MKEANDDIERILNELDAEDAIKIQRKRSNPFISKENCKLNTFANYDSKIYKYCLWQLFSLVSFLSKTSILLSTGLELLWQPFFSQLSPL